MSQNSAHRARGGGVLALKGRRRRGLGTRRLCPGEPPARSSASAVEAPDRHRRSAQGRGVPSCRSGPLLGRRGARFIAVVPRQESRRAGDYDDVKNGEPEGVPCLAVRLRYARTTSSVAAAVSTSDTSPSRRTPRPRRWEALAWVREDLERVRDAVAGVRWRQAAWERSALTAAQAPAPAPGKSRAGAAPARGASGARACVGPWPGDLLAARSAGSGSA